MIPRFCKACGKPIPVPAKASAKAYAQRMHCSDACRQAMGWRPPTPVEPKSCQNCNRPIRRYPSEGPTHYAKRKFCSHKCSYVHKSRASRLRWNGSDNRPKPAPIRSTLPATTQQEWLELNGGPTICPTRYCAPIFHEVRSERFARKDGRVR